MGSELLLGLFVVFVFCYYAYQIIFGIFIPLYVYVLYLMDEKDRVKSVIVACEGKSLEAALLLDNLFVERFKYKILEAENTEDANNIRKWYNRELKFGIIFQMFISVIYLQLLSPLVIYYLYHKYKNRRASYRTMEDIKNESNYVLYLRGFETDYYYEEKDSLYSIIKNNVYRYDFFNERILSKYLGKSVKFFGIGMPKEIAAPNGATRIYMDDSCWRENVLQMIENCGSILILLHSKSNCIWEFEQILPYKDKVFCASYSNEMYQIVKERMADKVLLPPLIQEDRFWFKLTDNSHTIHPLHTKNDYKLLAKEMGGGR